MFKRFKSPASLSHSTETSINTARRRLFTRREIKQTTRMPWVIEEGFTDLCSRCNQCLEACEEQIIVSGDGGFPTINFELGECTFCYQCANACPAESFTSSAVLFKPQNEPPWQMKAHINQHCLAHQNVECRSCSESCEFFAITFKLTAGQVAQPQINTDSCNGCGACVSVCPSSAIDIHQASASTN